MPLSDRHLTLLRLALDHGDGLLPRPDGLVGAALHRMAAYLVAAAVVEEVLVDAEQPTWGKRETGEGIGLQITVTGRDAVRTEPAATMSDKEKLPSDVDDTSDLASGNRSSGPRPGSKRALLLDLVGRNGGVTIEDLADALGWQHHTIRAAITRLRQDNMAITRVKSETGQSLYVRAGSEPGDIGNADGCAA